MISVQRQCCNWVSVPNPAPWLLYFLILGATILLPEWVKMAHSLLSHALLCISTPKDTLNLAYVMWESVREFSIHWRSLDKPPQRLMLWLAHLQVCCASILSNMTMAHLSASDCPDCTRHQHPLCPSLRQYPNTHAECEYEILLLGFCPRPWL